MTRRDVLSCVHEPFGDAFYYGPERLGVRYADDAEAREASGFANTTYADVLQTIEESSEGVGFPISPNRLMMGVGGLVGVVHATPRFHRKVVKASISFMHDARKCWRQLCEELRATKPRLVNSHATWN